MEENTTTGTGRRDLLKGAAGLAAGAAAISMLPGERVAAGAQTPMSMTIDGVGTFEVLAYSWGASNSGTTHVGGGGGVGRANFQDISLTKFADSTSPVLLRLLATGAHTQRATLTVASKSGVAISLALTNLIVTSVSTGGSAGEESLTENLSLNFSEFEYTVGAASFAWDIATNSP